jgi:uncharacterized protein (TIGR03437 family)
MRFPSRGRSNAKRPRTAITKEIHILRKIRLASIPLLAALLSAQAPPPTIQAVTDLQGRTPTVAPGDPVIIRGSALTGAQRGSGNPAWLKVTVGGKPALVRLYAPDNIEAVLPTDLAPGSHPVVVTVNNAANGSGTVRVAAVAPNLLTNDWSQAGVGMIIRYQSTPNMLENGLTEIRYPRPSAANPVIPGERVYVMATGLGVTNPPSTPLQFPERPVSIAAPVQLTAAGRQMLDVQAMLEPESHWPAFREINEFGSIMGWSRVYFTVPKDMPEGTHDLRITAGGVQGNTVRLLVGKPKTLITAVATSTGRWSGVSPGSLVTIYGINFGGTTANGGFTSYKAGEVQVEIDGKPAAILGVYEPQGQVNVVVPMDISQQKRVMIRLTTPQGTLDHPAVSYTVLPSIFKLVDPNDSNRSVAISTLANTAWLPIPARMATALKLPTDCAAQNIDPRSSCATPVRAGDILQIWVTGLGRATADGSGSGQTLPNGTVAPADGSVLYKVVTPVRVTIGGAPAEVLYAGIAPNYSGLYQVNIRIPAGIQPGDDVPVELTTTVGTQVISDRATVAVAP